MSNKPVKITTSSDNTYLVAFTDETENTWTATLVGETVPSFVFLAPDDATKDSLSGEIEFLELTVEDETSDTDWGGEYDMDEDEYTY